MRLVVATAALAGLAMGTLHIANAQQRLPIIDMHLHASAANSQGPPPVAICTPIDPFPAWDPRQPYQDVILQILKKPACSDPVWSPRTDAELLAETRAVVERLNIYAVLSGSPALVDQWVSASPDRFMPATSVRSIDTLRARHQAGKLSAIAEFDPQYEGTSPDDPRLEPYWALAEELDVPIGIHIGPGPPGVIYFGAPGYRARLHSALGLEEVLIRHRKVRVYVMHAGFPMLDDMLAVLYAHPQVHVDIGVIVYSQPRAAFYRYLQSIVEAGFGNRVMFGSDQMVWPGVIERSIAIIEEAPFLTASQKRDILYNNAARFLRLSADEIARHHGNAR